MKWLIYVCMYIFYLVFFFFSCYAIFKFLPQGQASYWLIALFFITMIVMFATAYAMDKHEEKETKAGQLKTSHSDYNILKEVVK